MANTVAFTFDATSRSISTAGRLFALDANTITITRSSGSWAAGDHVLTLYADMEYAVATCTLTVNALVLSGTLNLNTNEVEAIVNARAGVKRWEFTAVLMELSGGQIVATSRVLAYYVPGIETSTVSTANKVRVSGGELQLWNADQSAWITVRSVGADGAEQIEQN